MVADLAPAAVARQQTLGLDAPASAPLPADDTLLRVLLRNLRGNALRYSTPGAEVRVLVALPGPQHPRALRLQIDDSGPGLAEVDRQRLGQRLFRVLGAGGGAGSSEGSHARSHAGNNAGSSGSGLGWSIVQRSADVQRTTLAVAPSSALGGLQVTVDWPA